MTSTPQLLLNVNGLDTFYGRSQVLFGLTLSVARGESMALLGRNGAGKSTTMKSIMRMDTSTIMTSSRASWSKRALWPIPSCSRKS